MNLKKSVILTLGGVACAGLLYVSSGVASSAGEQQAKQAPTPEISGEWGATTIIDMEPIDSMFSHKNHVVRYGFTCDACHTELFEKRVGAAKAKGDYTMAAMAEGKYCGGCHNDEIAFEANAKANCTQCHAEPPEMVVFDKPVKAVIFDHSGHVDMGLDCSDCHSDVFEMEVGAAEHHPEEFTMKALYEGKYCGACHDGDLAFASNTRCTACHIGVKGFDRMFGKPTEGEGGHH